MNCKKKRTTKIFKANHHIHERHLEKRAMKRKSLITKGQFIDSIQNKTWFSCSERSKTIVKRAIKLQKIENRCQKLKPAEESEEEEPVDKAGWKLLHDK